MIMDILILKDANFVSSHQRRRRRCRTASLHRRCVRHHRRMISSAAAEQIKVPSCSLACRGQRCRCCCSRCRCCCCGCCCCCCGCRRPSCHLTPFGSTGAHADVLFVRDC